MIDLRSASLFFKLSDRAEPARLQTMKMIKRLLRVDRISQNGNITEHLNVLSGPSDDTAEKYTLCGILIDNWQDPYSNARCRRCERIREHFYREAEIL